MSDQPCPFLPGLECQAERYRGFCPQCKYYPDNAGDLSIHDVWQTLESMALPPGESRPTDGGSMSPLTAEGDVFWRWICFHEPYPHNDEHIAAVREDLRRQGRRGQELREFLQILASQIAQADLPAIWWEGRQCFWARDIERFVHAGINLLNARVAINTCHVLLRENRDV